MDGLDFIEITINKISAPIEISIDIDNNLISFNQNQQIITNSKIEELLRIIRTWDNYYGQSNNIDDEKFTIKIISNNEEEVISSDGVLPKNYNELIEWISDYNG